MATMDFGRLADPTTVFKRKFRWLFFLSDFGVVSSAGSSNASTVVASSGNTGHVCRIAARPSMTFNEQEVRHVIETVYLPARTQWNPIEITVFDVDHESYLYQWMKIFYDPEKGAVNPVGFNTGTAGIGDAKKTGTLQLLDGHAKILEEWQLQGCWPNQINWGTLDYSSSETADINFTIRYDRAVLSNPTS
jgi:hypothetical protein